MNYTFDLGINALWAVGMGLFALCYAYRLLCKRPTNGATAHSATHAQWEAWQAVSERALEEGKEVPPIPGSTLKR